MKEAGRQITGVHRHIKNNSRTYVFGPTQTGGYGLLPTLSDHDLYVAANALALNETFLYAGPGDVMFSHGLLGQYAERLVFGFLKASANPDGVSNQTLGDALKDPAFKRGAVMPLMAIVTVGSEVILFYSSGDQNFHHTLVS